MDGSHITGTTRSTSGTVRALPYPTSKPPRKPKKKGELKNRAPPKNIEEGCAKTLNKSPWGQRWFPALPPTSNNVVSASMLTPDGQSYELSRELAVLGRPLCPEDFMLEASPPGNAGISQPSASTSPPMQVAAGADAQEIIFSSTHSHPVALFDMEHLGLLEPPVGVSQVASPSPQPSESSDSVSSAEHGIYDYGAGINSFGNDWASYDEASVATSLAPYCPDPTSGTFSYYPNMAGPSPVYDTVNQDVPAPLIYDLSWPSTIDTFSYLQTAPPGI